MHFEFTTDEHYVCFTSTTALDRDPYEAPNALNYVRLPNLTQWPNNNMYTYRWAVGKKNENKNEGLNSVPRSQNSKTDCLIQLLYPDINPPFGSPYVKKKNYFFFTI